MSTTVTATQPRAVRRYQLESGLGHMTPAERAERGKAARAAVPRESHAGFEPQPDRPDPIELLEEQSAGRVADLVPVRYGRMMVSPLYLLPRGRAADGQRPGWYSGFRARGAGVR